MARPQVGYVRDNFGQGFYLAHPLDPAAATDLLESERLRTQEFHSPRS